MSSIRRSPLYIYKRLQWYNSLEMCCMAVFLIYVIHLYSFPIIFYLLCSNCFTVNFFQIVKLKSFCFFSSSWGQEKQMSPFDSFTWDVLVLLRQFITVIYKLQKTSYRIRHAFLLPPFPSYFLTFPPLACSEPFMTLPACMRIYLQASHIDCINN